MCRRAARMCKGTTRSFPRAFGYDEEGGGSNVAPYSYLFAVARSRSTYNEAAWISTRRLVSFLSYAPRGPSSRGVDDEAA